MAAGWCSPPWRLLPGAERKLSYSESGFDVGSLDFTGSEVRQFRTFLDGAIMSVGVRHNLWRSWGLCPRHAWGYAITEVELRSGMPFSTAILYADLSSRAERLVGRRRPWQLVRPNFESRSACFTCSWLETVARVTESEEVDWRRHAARVNQRRRVHERVAEARSTWLGKACPLCVSRAGGLVCRLHLLAGAAPPDGLARALAQLTDRLETLADSLTVRRTVTDVDDRFAWVEALGWFGGWDYAQKLMREAGCRVQ